MKRRPLDKSYHHMSDEALMDIFNNIEHRPENIVKRTGFVKLSAAKFGDQILDFVATRRAASAHGEH